MRHVVWDWNGTLLDDLTIVVDAVNATLEEFGVARIDADGYRDNYQRPVRRFYDILFGRPVADDEWGWIDDHFHEAYRASLGRATPAPDAVDAMRDVATAGATQSLLSMWWHEELVPAVTHYGLDGFFVRIDGNSHDAGAVKSAHLRRHLKALQQPARGVTVMIGDSMDDAAAAREVGVDCVMYDGGSHHRHELEATGYPVAATLVDAVRIALR